MVSESSAVKCFNVKSECLVFSVCFAVEIQTSACYVCVSVLSCVCCRALRLCVHVHEHASSLASVSSQGRAVLIQWCVLRSPFSAFPSECSSFYALGQPACSSSLSTPKYTHTRKDTQADNTHSQHTHSSLPLHIFGSILFGRNPALTLTVATHVEPPEATNHE